LAGGYFMSDGRLIVLERHPDGPREACGVLGIWGKERSAEVAHLCYLGLYALQHRGQEGAGIVTFDGERMRLCKGVGLVPDVFDEDNLAELEGFAGIGHVRLAGKEERHVVNTQPFLVRSSYGSLAAAQNGRLLNGSELQEKLLSAGTVLQTDSDSELILNLIAQSGEESLPAAVAKTLELIEGAYALVVLSEDMLLAARDPWGNRPLSLGRLDEGYMVASESCAIANLGGEVIREVEPGELLILDQGGWRTYRQQGAARKALCSFEHVYFARPDSCIGGKNAYLVRKAIGRELAKEAPVNADVVIGAPDSGVAPALGFAEAAGLPFEIGVIKNRYVGRTFMRPTQAARRMAVRIKLNPVVDVLHGKRVAVVDDSIVRGTTSGKLITLLRDAGAREVHMYVASPPYRFPCFYGNEPSSQSELVASGRTLDELKDLIGADSLHYISIDGLVRAIGIPRDQLCLACFTGEYPIAPANYWREEDGKEHL
jgi:amidophosphoribosyltransferase